jgi:hypothetical protein
MDFFGTALVVIGFHRSSLHAEHGCNDPFVGVNAVTCIALEGQAGLAPFGRELLPTSDLHECKNSSVLGTG